MYCTRCFILFQHAFMEFWKIKRTFMYKLIGLSTTYLFLHAAKQLHKFLTHRSTIIRKKKAATRWRCVLPTQPLLLYQFVLLCMYAALQKTRFHTCATKHLFMLPTSLWLRGQPPDSAIFLASSTYCHTGPPQLFAQFYNNLECRHAQVALHSTMTSPNTGKNCKIQNCIRST